MKNKIVFKYIVIVFVSTAFSACGTLKNSTKKPNILVPGTYLGTSKDSTNSATLKWREYFADQNLVALIDTALKNNQELNITLQEIEITRNEIKTRKGEYLPFVGFAGGTGVDKVGRYTRNGALEANNEIEPGREFPDPLSDYMVEAYASWEIDIWKKLRNAKKSALARYLATVEGKNFLVTNLVAEISNSYYELLTLDNQLALIKQNIEIQTNALEIVRLQKQSAKVTELAVKRFEAQVLRTKSLQFDIQQQIIETENKINFLVGRMPQPVLRNTNTFNDIVPNIAQSGEPSQLLSNRPDIKQAELQLQAANLDVKVAKAYFYPSLGISAGIGLQAFNAAYLLKTPESMLYSLFGDLMAPLVNRNALKANFYNANAKQIQAVYDYERTVLNAYIEVIIQLSNVDNLSNSYTLRAQQVEALNQSVEISTNLFSSARADYMEVLLTQREALESKFELIEVKKKQMNAMVNIYRALGGGWR